MSVNEIIEHCNSVIQLFISGQQGLILIGRAADVKCWTRSFLAVVYPAPVLSGYLNTAVVCD